MKIEIELDEFTRAYVECALWSSSGRDTEFMDGQYSIDNIAFLSLRDMIDDCEKFQRDNAADLDKYRHPSYTSGELGGHDFWLTRNGHGAGFWDRTDCLPKESRDRLTNAARKFGSCFLYVGDDGLIYCER